MRSCAMFRFLVWVELGGDVGVDHGDDMGVGTD